MATGTNGKSGLSVDLTTGIGTLSFPHLSASAAANNKNDKGEPSYDVQIIIPKSQRDDIRAIVEAMRKVGEDKWGDQWKKRRLPLRDGDKEADDPTEDGSTKGEKYPERAGCFFLNARSTRPVTVVDRERVPIEAIDADVYGGCKGKIAVTFYAYSTAGNHGIGVRLNGVQKIADGEPFGAARPTVESMFDMEESLGDDLDGDVLDEEPKGKKGKKGKKSKGDEEEPDYDI